MIERNALRSDSWRPQRRASVLQYKVVRVGLLAVGVVVMLGVGYGGYTFMSRSPGAVPVIEADSRPLRIRPVDPGGMQVAGAEELIMGGTANRHSETMAPPPEIPQPQALRAQIQAARPAPAPAPAPASAPAASLLPAAVATPVQPAAGAGMQVQLAALDSEPAALAEWQRLAKKMPDLFSARRPVVLRAERDGKTIYRLRTSGFADVLQATNFCMQLKAKGVGCSIATF